MQKKKYITNDDLLKELYKNYNIIAQFLENSTPEEVEIKRSYLNLLYSVNEVLNSVIKNNILSDIDA